MSLSLKAELETWAAALKAYDEQDFEKALDLFSCIADSSKVFTNIGLIYATIGEHETAVEHFVAATNLDSYLAIAHFQCGVSNFLLERYDLALLNFEDAYLYLRGNEAINYEQIGLKFKLFSAEIMFNKGLARMNLGYAEGGMADMREASTQKVTNEHGVIDEAIRDRGEGYTVFSIPVGVLYRPSENKLKNSKSKDYLGKAKLVAASDSNDAFTEFTGVMKLQQASGENLDNKDEDKSDAELSVLSRSATAPAPRALSTFSHISQFSHRANTGTDPVTARPIALERSKTTLQLGPGVRPDIIIASRRTQSVSNPVNVPPLPLAPDLPRNNTALGRSNTTRLARSATTSAGVMPLRVKTPQGTAGAGPGSSRVGAETGAAAGGAPMMLRSQRSQQSLRRPQGQGTTQVGQQSAPLPPPQSLQPGQYVNTTQSVTPLVLPAAPVPAQGGGHITQSYDSYIDLYTDNPASRLASPRPLTAHTQPSASSPQRHSPQRHSPVTSLLYQQPQPQRQEQQQLPAWMQSDPSLARMSSHTSSSSGLSRAPSRAANAGMVNLNSNMAVGGANMGKGSIGNPSGGTLRRKSARRPATRRVTMYDDEEGDDGFVTGENDEFEMANIRVKLHYQGDVRGMAIPPTTSFDEFVERVTAKFGTSLMGLGMKFTDEEGTKISLRDESDFDLAIETARESAKGRSEGKIEIWCIDVV
ncbi:hypothetical protein J3R83DRAFT_2781 [Lanmaoa asiatica]|nr:hypothetical protein J3R83DRAFT_2781 [Lanmaoa asiatica]